MVMKWTREQDIALVGVFVSRATGDKPNSALYAEAMRLTGQTYHRIKHRITHLGLSRHRRTSSAGGCLITPVEGMTIHLMGE